ncbi:MAG: glutamine-hydrolyzing carbamoyl-phosphate synthase small subunit [Acidobacteriia bacterium]|nr:glutamine-hydrolyzing carbamoyl-phosphate synthase small subunit [Terriglobia bacterium]
MNFQTAILALEDGLCFRGHAFGAPVERTGEVIFNTSLSGYQEIFTDPSYCGQIVVLTNPEVGNYGLNRLDEESRQPFIEGLVVREHSPVASNWRSEWVLGDYLKQRGVPAVSEIDTRALVRHLRDRGSMRAVISSVDTDEHSLVKKACQAPSMVGLDLAQRVTCPEKYGWKQQSADIFAGKAGTSPSFGAPGTQVSSSAQSLRRFQVVAYDFGIKYNILRRLSDVGCDVTVVPAQTSAEEALALQPDGIFLSNGPGDPEPVSYAVNAIRGLMGRKPIFGICLGHQLLGLALGGKTYKLKFGHHGGNQPVKNLMTGKVEITAQNHGFAVDPDSLKDSELEITHLNLNDHTCEGMRHRSLPVFSVQYHPEASPGPHDASYLFNDFIKLMSES